MLNSKKSIRYRTGRNFSYRSVNRYRNSYVCTGLTGENRVFGPVKKKPEKHTTKKEKKSQEDVIATAFSLATFSVSPSCSTVLVLQPSSYPYFFFFFSSSVLHVFLVSVLKIWLEGMPSLFPSCLVRWPVLFSMQKLKNIYIYTYIKSEFLGHVVDGKVLRVWKKLWVLPFSMWLTATVFLKLKIYAFFLYFFKLIELYSYDMTFSLVVQELSFQFIFIFIIFILFIYFSL